MALQDRKRLNGGFKHVGYMDKVFKSEKRACKYYRKHNRHMRPIGVFGVMWSDWDPETKLRYVVRQYYGECLSIREFKTTVST